MVLLHRLDRTRPEPDRRTLNHATPLCNQYLLSASSDHAAGSSQLTGYTLHPMDGTPPFHRCGLETLVGSCVLIHPSTLISSPDIPSDDDVPGSNQIPNSKS